jgi:hypothetical protein
MADVVPHAGRFAELRPVVLARLMDVRAGLDPGLAQLDEADARAQLGAVLGQVEAYLRTGDPAPLRKFLRSFLTVRAAQGLAPDSLLQAVVAIGDTCVQVVQQTGGAAAADLACELTHTGAVVTRLVVQHIADELARRTAAHRELLEGVS